MLLLRLAGCKVDIGAHLPCEPEMDVRQVRGDGRVGAVCGRGSAYEISKSGDEGWEVEQRGNQGGSARNASCSVGIGRVMRCCFCGREVRDFFAVGNVWACECRASSCVLPDGSREYMRGPKDVRCEEGCLFVPWTYEADVSEKEFVV